MPLSLEEFSDDELLTFCELAEEIADQIGMGKAATDAEDRFLEILVAKGLWIPGAESEIG